MTRRYTAAGLILAFLIGGAVGGFAWSQIAAEPVHAPGERVRSSQAGETHTRSPRVDEDGDLLDVVDSVQSISGVESCRMAEMYGYSPLSVRAFCETASGDELRVVYHNDASAQEADITAYCDKNTGPAFIPLTARWSVFQVSEGDTSGPDPGLTTALSHVLLADPVTCP